MPTDRLISCLLAHSGRAAVLAVSTLSAAAAQEPLSAIDWLRNHPPVQAVPVTPAEPPVSAGATTPEVTVQSIDAAWPEAVGLLPASMTGLPLTLWSASEAATLTELIDTLRPDRHPAMLSLLYTLLLAEADPPLNGADRSLLRTRVGKLMDLGAIEPAEALLARAGLTHPGLFPLAFDAALLNGETDTACATLLAQPDLSDDLGARVFCIARSGDWQSAATVLGSASALGELSRTDFDLLARFLDPEVFEGLPPPRVPLRPSPLEFRLFEAIGEPLPTARLPRSFAITDLKGDAGWKSQIEAAERLARVGAIAENRLIGVYSAHRPAASGGVWDRVDAVQDFDRALATGREQAIAPALARVWPAMRAAGLAVPFARFYGETLLHMPLSGTAREDALEIVLLSPAYENAAPALEPGTARQKFLAGLARGTPTGAAPTDAAAMAVQDGFGSATPPEALQQLLKDGHLGEAILRAMHLYIEGTEGDLRPMTDALATFRAVGLEDTARRAALQYLALGG